MPILPRYFARVPESVNFSLLQSQLVVIIGVGMVGSPIAEKLARSAVGHLRFIDDDFLETENLGRHILPVEYIDDVQPWNKAEGMADYLAKQVEGLTTEAIPRKIDESVSDSLLDEWLHDADLVVAATDDRQAQRRIGQRALGLGIPAIFPALYPKKGGGEIVVQIDDAWPCFGCWDYFRTNTEQLRGVNALDLSGEPVVHVAVRLCLGILDPGSEDGEMMKGNPGNPPNQLFMLDRAATLRRALIEWRRDCPACAAGVLSLDISEPRETHTVLGWAVETSLEAQIAALREMSAYETDATTLEERSAYPAATLSGSTAEPETSQWWSTTPLDSHPPADFDFGEWIGSCIMCSLFMLVPDIWISIGIRAILIGRPTSFNFTFYIVLSGVLGVVIATIMSAWES
jgi:hypothetical protein